MVNIETMWDGTQGQLVEQAVYGNNDLALRLWTQPDSEYGREVYAVASVNLEAQGLHPAPGCVFVKDYAENEGMAAALTVAGVVRPTGRVVQVGPYDGKAVEAEVLYRDEEYP